MNTFTICKQLASYLKNYTALNTFCDQTFAKRPHFFVGFDGRNAPADTFIPFIAIVPASRQIQDGTHEEHSITIAVVCTDDSNSTSNGITEYEGYKTLSSFEALVFDGIQGFFNEKIIGSSMLSWGNTQYNGYWPEYHATRDITIATATEI